MRQNILSAALLILAASTGAFAQTANRAATEKALIANENKINEAVIKHDAAAFTALLAPDAVSADMGGFTKAADFAKTLDQLKVASWHIMSPQVVWIDDKAAVVTYTWMGQGTYMNQPIPAQTFSSTVWAERGGKWLAVFHQETAAAPPPKPAPAKKQ